MSAPELRWHFENHERGGSFLDLALDGRCLTRRFGRLGHTPAGKRETKHPSPELARRSAEAQIHRALQKGYWPGHHHPGFIRSIRAASDDAALYMAYGAWLRELGDPRGDLIEAATDEARNRILDTHALILRPVEWAKLLELEWFCGFVRTARLSSPGLAHLDSTALLGSLRRLLRHPSAAFLRRLDLRAPPHLEAHGRKIVSEHRPSTLELITVSTRGMKKDLEGLDGMRVEVLSAEHL